MAVFPFKQQLMKGILTLVFASACYLVHAQTAIIYHKSHSGVAASFFTDPNTNFGEPGPQLIQIVRLNDSTYIQVYSEFSGMIYQDTVHKNRSFSSYNPQVDSIYQQAYYKDYIEYINLKNGADPKRVKEPSLQLQKMIEAPQTTPEKQEIQPVSKDKASKKKKKSYLLFLFGITGGGMFLIRLFRRSASLQSSIA